jgi:hypothetical protein
MEEETWLDDAEMHPINPALDWDGVALYFGGFLTPMDMLMVLGVCAVAMTATLATLVCQ